MNRNFNEWIKTFKNNIATWNYYVDFDKVYQNVDLVKDSLNILNGLIGAADIEKEFLRIVTKYPETISVIPILLAKREKEIKINSPEQNYNYNFKKPNYTVEEYAKFMKNTGLFELMQKHIIHSLVDYVMGIEVGMDTNGRKNRTGDAMEDLVESYLVRCGLVKNVTYFKEMDRSAIEKKWNIDLSNISNTGKTEKRFDFVVKTHSDIYAIETNFYSTGGSKPNETARSYKNLALEAKEIKGFYFVWITDGAGWFDAKHNLEETFDVMDNLYSLSDLEGGVFETLFTD